MAMPESQAVEADAHSPGRYVPRVSSRQFGRPQGELPTPSPDVMQTDWHPPAR